MPAVAASLDAARRLDPDPILGSGSGQRQLTFFNHAYGVLDTATADAIEDSDYLAEFANFVVQTSTDGDGNSWTGRYLLGRTTYVEIFGVGDLPGSDGELGSTGLGISTEIEGDIELAVSRLQDEGVANPIRHLRMLDLDGDSLPWFDEVRTTSQYTTMNAWAMEYRQEFFADPRIDTEPPNFPGDVGRERYNSDTYLDRQMRDVVGVHIGTAAADLTTTLPLLRAGGFHVRQNRYGAVVTGGGTILHLEVVPPRNAGLKMLTMQLNEPVDHVHRVTVGNSTLIVGGGPLAHWHFHHTGQPSPNRHVPRSSPAATPPNSSPR